MKKLVVVFLCVAIALGGAGLAGALSPGVAQAVNGNLGDWSVVSMMGGERGNAVAVTFGNSLYLIGGSNNSNTVANVERSVINGDGSLGTWSTVSMMTTPRRYHAAVAPNNGYVYAIGGDNGSSVLGSVERAQIQGDGALSGWAVISMMTTNRRHLAAVAAGGYLYAIGGENGSATLNSVERAQIKPDGSLGPWSVVSQMAGNRKFTSAIVAGNYIYVVGGDNGSGSLNSVERAQIMGDGSLGAWSVVSLMSGPRRFAALMVANGYLYALGGDDGSKLLSTVERAQIKPDGSLAEWSQTRPMTAVRTRFGLVVSPLYVYAIGGWTTGNQYLASVERAPLDGSDYTSPPATSTPSPTPTSDRSKLLSRAAPIVGNSNVQYFQETGHNLGYRFRDYWRANGGLEMFGFPITEEYVENGFITQWFERARFEYHPENPDPYKVLLGLLGRETTVGRAFPESAAFQSGTDRWYFPETRHSLSFGFLNYWKSHGGLAVFGYPISEEFQEKSATDGKTYTVQYFERERFEYHPELKGTKFETLLGLLGSEILKRQ